MTRRTRNILFIMCDQLRWDYLSCDGHPKLHTPNIDALAARGVRFTRAYVQSPVCGASRMSFYTGRYVQSHGATWNGVPLKVGEMTLGDYLRPLGRAHRAGRQDAHARRRGGHGAARHRSQLDHRRARRRMRLRPLRARRRPARASAPTAATTRRLPRYNRYLNDKGYAGDNPWHDWANAAAGRGQQRSPPAGPCGMRASPRASRRRIPRRPT